MPLIATTSSIVDSSAVIEIQAPSNGKICIQGKNWFQRKKIPCWQDWLLQGVGYVEVEYKRFYWAKFIAFISYSYFLLEWTTLTYYTVSHTNDVIVLGI